MCKTTSLVLLIIIGLSAGCQSPSTITESCDLSDYGIEETGICTQTQWQDVTYKVIRSEGVSETTQQFAYRTWDSTHFAQDEYGLRVSYRYDVFARANGSIDSTWSIVRDSLAGAIPWYRYEERHQRSTGAAYSLVERSIKQHQSASRDDFSTLQERYLDGQLLGSTKVERAGENWVRTSYDHQGQLSQYLRFSQAEEQRQVQESYLLMEFDPTKPSDYYGQWSDSTDLMPESIRYERRLEGRAPFSVLIEWQPTAPRTYWTLAQTRVLFDRYLPMLEPYFNAHRATVLILLNEQQEACKLVHSMRPTPNASLEESSKTFNAGCSEDNIYGRFSVSIANPN